MINTDKSYLHRRSKMEMFVNEVLNSCNLKNDVIRGSWKHNDFHLAFSKDITYSDLDLVIPNTSLKGRSQLQQIIHDKLRKKIKIKVKIHPLESMDGMTIQDSKLLLIGEYIISMFRKVPAGVMTSDYVRAKITLLFLRQSIQERYIKIARRVSKEPVWSALEVKLGIADKFSEADVVQSLKKYSDSNIERFLNNCLNQKIEDDFLNEWKTDVMNALSIEDWLKQFVIDRVEEALEL